jgi:hypothetical protein
MASVWQSFVWIMCSHPTSEQVFHPNLCQTLVSEAQTFAQGCDLGLCWSGVQTVACVGYATVNFMCCAVLLVVGSGIAQVCQRCLHSTTSTSIHVSRPATLCSFNDACTCLSATASVCLLWSAARLRCVRGWLPRRRQQKPRRRA